MRSCDTGEPRNALAFLDSLIEEIAARVAERLSAPTSRYATAKDNPIGAARPFLDAARDRKFENFKRGREVCALWVDVERWIESRQRAPRTPKLGPVDNDRVELEAAGVRLLPRGRHGAGRTGVLR